MSAFAFAAMLSSAQPQSELKVEPRTFLVTIDPDSAQAVCPKQGDVIKVKMTTGKAKRNFELNPRSPGEKYISSAAPPLSKNLENNNGKLGLVSGVMLEITTADGKTYKEERLALPAGANHDILQVTCIYEQGTWRFSFFAD